MRNNTRRYPLAFFGPVLFLCLIVSFAGCNNKKKSKYTGKDGAVNNPGTFNPGQDFPPLPDDGGGSTGQTTGEPNPPPANTSGGGGGSTTVGANSTTTSAGGATAGSTAGVPPTQDQYARLDPEEGYIIDKPTDPSTHPNALFIGGSYPSEAIGDGLIISVFNKAQFGGQTMFNVSIEEPANLGIQVVDRNACGDLGPLENCKFYFKIVPTVPGLFDFHIRISYRLTASGNKRYLSVPVRYFAKHPLMFVGSHSGPAFGTVRNFYTQKIIAYTVPAFEQQFAGEVHTAVCDFNNDGFDDLIVAAGPGGGPRVTVFDGKNTANVLANFFAYASNFTGGVSVACGQIFKDNFRNFIVTSAFSLGASHVRAWAYNSASQEPTDTGVSYYAFDGVNTGARVAVADVDNNGYDDIIVGSGPQEKARFVVLNCETVAKCNLKNKIWEEVYPFGDFNGGLSVAAGDLDSYPGAEVVVVPSNGGGPALAYYNGSGALPRQWAFNPEHSTGSSIAIGGGKLFAARLGVSDELRVWPGLSFELEFVDLHTLLNRSPGGWVSTSHK